MDRHIRLRPEYGKPPIWIATQATPGTRAVQPDELGLPPHLSARIAAWDAEFQATYVAGDKHASGFASASDERDWHLRGRGLASEMSLLLGETVTHS